MVDVRNDAERTAILNRDVIVVVDNGLRIRSKLAHESSGEPGHANGILR